MNALSQPTIRLGDHVSFERHLTGHTVYGVVKGFTDNQVGGEFISILPEGSDKTVSIPFLAVRLYARARATK